MNLTNLLADCYRRLDYPAAPATSTVTRLTSFLNTTHRQILGTPGLDSLRDDTITFASVIGQSLYGLPPAITRIEAITDRTTMVRLRLRPLDAIRDTDPGLVMTGTPDSWIPRGWQQVALQPVSALALFVKSTSAADVAPLTVYVEGIRTGGYPVSLSVALTGVTAVTLSATITDLVEVTKCYVSAACAGVVTLTTVSGAGAELARIQIGQTYARYLGIQLYPTPVAVVTYFVDYVRTLPEMVNGTDEPLLPEGFHYLLVEGTLLKEWTRLDDDRRGLAERDYLRGLSQFQYFQNCPADYLPSRLDRGGESYSRFGPYFPAGE